MWVAVAPAPVAPSDWHNAHLSDSDSASDSSGHLLSALDAQANVPVAVAYSHEGLEPGDLTSSADLLHRHDLHDLLAQWQIAVACLHRQ